MNLVEVIVYSSPDDRKKNRGFCFLEYDSHKAASLAKRKLGTGRQKFWGCDILVDWADPQEEPDQETMSKVKVLYVRNLVSGITEDDLRQTFSQHGNVDRVKKIKDYAFIHFEDRDQADAAMNNLDKFEMHGVKISVSLAKPPSDRRKKEEILRNRERRVTQMMQQRAQLGLGSNAAAVAAAAMAVASGVPNALHPVLHPALAAAVGHHALSGSVHPHHHHHASPGIVNHPHQTSSHHHTGHVQHHPHQGMSNNPAHLVSGSGRGPLGKGSNHHRSSASSSSFPSLSASNQLPHNLYGRQAPSYRKFT